MLLCALGIPAAASCVHAPPFPAGSASLFPGQSEKRGPSPFLTLFGKRYLAGVDVVAEVHVAGVRQAGMGTDVVTLKPERIIVDYLSPGERSRKGIRIFCNRGEFVEGTRFLLFLSRYGSGRMYTASRCLSFFDRDYREKNALIGEYIKIEKIRDGAKRRRALKNLLFGRINDDSSWVRWNVLRELENLLGDTETSFTVEDAVKIKGATRKNRPESFKKKLDAITEAILERVEKEKKNRRKDHGGNSNTDSTPSPRPPLPR
jgi:hypothetical protein